MAYDEELAVRLREELAGERAVSEQRMFGGLAFLINGNMAVSVSSRGGLLLRVDPARTDELVRDEFADRFQMRGREMDGWLWIDPAGLHSDEALHRWVALGIQYAGSLPAKPVKR